MSLLWNIVQVHLTEIEMELSLRHPTILPMVCYIMLTLSMVMTTMVVILAMAKAIGGKTIVIPMVAMMMTMMMSMVMSMVMPMAMILTVTMWSVFFYCCGPVCSRSYNCFSALL